MCEAIRVPPFVRKASKKRPLCSHMCVAICVPPFVNTRFARASSCRFFDPSKGALLTLQVFAFDKYENIITDSDRVKAVINGDVGNAVDLLPPTYTYDLEFALDYAGEVKIGFVLADSQGKLWHLPNSPFNIEVSPPVEAAGTDFGLIGGIIAGVLVVASLVFYFIDRTHQRKAAAVKASLEQEGQQQQHLNSVRARAKRVETRRDSHASSESPRSRFIYSYSPCSTRGVPLPSTLAHARFARRFYRSRTRTYKTPCARRSTPTPSSL